VYSYNCPHVTLFCQPKDQGGLGIEVLELKNKCLLSKWFIKLLSEEGTWHKLLYNKYVKNQTLSQVEVKPTDSPFWKGLMRVKNDFFSRGYFKIGDGSSVRFWEDIWLGDKPLAQQYSSLYRIVNHKNVLVANVLQGFPLNIAFRRNLDDQKCARWMHLVSRLIEIELFNAKDVLR
jgi:hypothetical protein